MYPAAGPESSPTAIIFPGGSRHVVTILHVTSALCCCAGLGTSPAGSVPLGSTWISSTTLQPTPPELSCVAGLRAAPAGGIFPPLPPPTGLLRPEGGPPDFNPPQQASVSPSGYQPPPGSLSAGSQSGPLQQAAVLQVCTPFPALLAVLRA